MAAQAKKPGRVQKFVESIKVTFSEIWRQTPGKAGLILLSVLIVMAIVAMGTISPEFLVKWESPTYWEDNSVVAPPCWIRNLGYKVSMWDKAVLDKPSNISVVGNDIVLIYNYTYNLDVENIPQDILVKAEAPVLRVNETEKLPVLSVYIERPDGTYFKAWEFPLKPVNETITANTTAIGKTEVKELNLMDLVTTIINAYNLTIPRELVGSNEYISLAESITRNTISEEIKNRYLTIQAVFIAIDSIEFTLNRNTSELQTLLSNIESVVQLVKGANVTDTVKQGVINSLNMTYGNISAIINNIDKITLSEYIEYLEKAKTAADDASRRAIRLPSDIRGKVSDIYSAISKLSDRAEGTDYVFKPIVKFKILTGNYRVDTIITYHGVGNVPVEMLNAKVTVVVKGNCQGILGTANKGIDIATVILYGTPIALSIGLVTAVASVFIGVIAGIVSGYYGGWIDEVIQRTVDVMSQIPFLPLMIIIGTIAQKTFVGEYKSLYIILTYIAVLVVFGWVGLARTVRAMTLSIKEEPYIEAARALGASNTRIIFKHIFPQVMMYATAVLVFSVPDAILTEAGLSVLGLRHGWPTWGSLLANARYENRYDVWWWIIPPGLMLSLTSLTFVLLGLAIERIVEPRLRTA